jgi:tetratricopeptide (TPR) repeat protein
MTRLVTTCVLTVALMSLSVCPRGDDADSTPLAEDAAMTKAWDLLKESRRLINSRDYAEAEKKLLEARSIAPDYVEIYTNLGYLYELQEMREAALHAYAELLRRRPTDDYGRTHLDAIFYEGRFPRAIATEDIEFSPVHFVVDRCLLTEADEITAAGIAYTKDLLFHEDMKRGGDPVYVNVPAAGGNKTELLNRAAYGFVSHPSSRQLNMTFSLFYASSFVNPSANDYQQLASQVLHLLLRAYWYFNTYLGKQPPVEGPVETYLLESGPPGAEAYSSSLYFYAAATPRSPIEWARQVGHEYGHLVLPPIGRYVEPEFYASGLLGERLFIQWLTEEAQAVAGSPWPGQAARSALDNLLGDSNTMDAAGYLADNAYADLLLWYDKGPDSAHIAGTGQESMHYWLGFIMWVQAALGKPGLRQVIDTAPGTSPADFLYALKSILRDRAAGGGFDFSAACLDLRRSNLTNPPAQGAFGWRDIRLGSDDVATFSIYIPAGVWDISLSPALPGAALVFDGKGPLPLDTGKGTRLGAVTEGWHTIQINGSGDATPLERITLTFLPDA